MAHLLVLLERVPHGLHPASHVAICAARDLANLRGATVTGLAVGDAEAFDDHVTRAASRSGIDQLVFGGPNGLATMTDRLRPRHILVPQTPRSTGLLEQCGLDAATPTWLGAPMEQPEDLPAIAGIIAGTLPWHAMPELIEPDFEGEVGEAAVPEWVAQSGGAAYRDPDLFYVAPSDLDDEAKASLERLGARAISPEDASQHKSGTLLWFDAGPAPLPAGLRERPATGRLVYLPGPNAAADGDWALCDWVMPGEWSDAIATLNQDAWKAALR